MERGQSKKILESVEEEKSELYNDAHELIHDETKLAAKLCDIEEYHDTEELLAVLNDNNTGASVLKQSGK